MANRPAMKAEELSVLVESLLSSLETLSESVGRTQAEVMAKRVLVLHSIDKLRKEIFFRNTYELPRGWKRSP